MMISNVVLHSLPVGYRFDLAAGVRIAAPALRSIAAREAGLSE